MYILRFILGLPLIMLIINGYSQTSILYSQNFDGVTAPALPTGFYAYGGIADWITDKTIGYQNSNPNALYANSDGNYGDGVSRDYLTLTGVVATTGKVNITIEWFQKADNDAPSITLEYSNDGINWATVTGIPVPPTPPTSSSSTGALALQSNIADNQSNLIFRWSFVEDNSGNTYEIDDIVVKGSTPTNAWYSKSTNNLDLLASWTDQPDGSGSTNPTDFISNNITYNIRNRISATIGANWTVSGTNSKLIIGDGSNSCEFIIPSNFSVSGTIDVSNLGKLTLQNTILPTLGTLSTGSSVNFDAVGTQTYSSSTSTQFWGLQINGLTGSGNKSIASVVGNVTVAGILDIVNGSLAIQNGSGKLLYISGSISGLGVLTTSGTNGRMDLSGTGNPGTIRFSPGVSLNTFIFNRTGQTLNLGTDLAVSSAFTNTAGTISIGNNNLNINASATTGSGQITSGLSGRATYSGSAANVFSGSYGILSFTGSGTRTLAGDISIAQNFTIPSPITLSAGSQTISVAGNFAIAFGSTISGTGHTIVFSGNSNQSLLSNGQLFRNLSFPNNNTITLLDATNVTQNLSITGGATLDAGINTLNGGSTLNINNGTLRLAKTGVTLPELTGTYAITGGNIEFYGNGSQIVRGSRAYNNLMFSGSTSSSISSAISNLNGVSITGTAILDVGTNTFGNGSSTNLTMSGTSTFKTGGSGTKPDIDGNYFLGSGTTIEFSGSTSNTIRTLSSNQNSGAYQNIAFSGSGSHALNSSATNLKVSGNFIDNSTSFSANGGTVSLIGTGDQTVSGNLTFYDLTITKPTSGSVVISPSSTSISILDFLIISLSGSNQLNTNGNLTLASNTTKTASLIDYNNTVNAINGSVTVQRYYVGAGKPKMFGSPVAGSTVSTLGEGTWKVLLYTETGQESGIPRLANSFSGSFRNANLVNSGALSVGRGYTIRKDANGTINFIGTVNNGPLTFEVTSTSGTYAITPGGFNLLSNPYPSAIDWTKVNPNATGVPTVGVQIWNGSAYSPTANIASGQAFFVRATNSGNINIDNNARITSGTLNNNFLRTEEANKWLYLYAKSITGGFNDALAFTFDNDATNGYDPNFDLPKIYIATAPSSPLLFSRPDGTRLSLDVRPFPTTDLVIPITIIVNASGNYSFTTSSINDWYSDYSVFLKDSTNEGIILTNLKTVDEYKFVKNTIDTDAATRFSIIFKYTPQANNSTTTGAINTPGGNNNGNGGFSGGETALLDTVDLTQGIPDSELRVDTVVQTTSIKNSSELGSNIYAKQNGIVIEFGNDLSDSEIQVSDLLGRIIYKSTAIISKGVKHIDFDHTESAIYIVKIVNNRELITKKIILN